jgi:Cu+-exporting ATPase
MTGSLCFGRWVVGLLTIELALGSTGCEREKQSATLAIDGMTCASCTNAIRTTVQQLSGVQSCNVSLDRKEALVTFFPALVRLEQVIEAITRLGYKARLKGPISGPPRANHQSAVADPPPANPSAVP